MTKPTVHASLSKESLQTEITNTNGAFIFSDGTLNLQHLLSKAYDLLVAYNLQDAKHGIGDLKTSILECFKPLFDTTMEQALERDNSLFACQYHGRCELLEYRHGDIALSPHDVWEAAFSYFESLAPEGYYFGSQEGDGACIGWFHYDLEEQNI